jgi:hypothetical protein
MKKLLAILLALCMVMSLAACGAEDKDEEKEEKKTEATDSVDKDDKEDKEDKEDKDDKGDEDADDSSNIAHVMQVYEPAIFIYKDILVGDTSEMAATMPSEMWALLAEMNGTTEDDIIAQFKDAYSTMSDVFLEADIEIVSSEDAKDRIDDIKEALDVYGIDFDISDAVEINVKWIYEVADEYKEEIDAEDNTDHWYVIEIGYDWYVLSEEFAWNILT